MEFVSGVDMEHLSKETAENMLIAEKALERWEAIGRIIALDAVTNKLGSISSTVGKSRKL